MLVISYKKKNLSQRARRTQSNLYKKKIKLRVLCDLCEKFYYDNFSDSLKQISAVLKSPRRRYSSLIFRRKKASFFGPKFKSKARS